MILKRTKATQILSGYIVFLFVSAAIIQLVEPDINRYGDALWYCYAVLSTAGFGDIVAMTFVDRLEVKLMDRILSVDSMTKVEMPSPRQGRITSFCNLKFSFLR